MFKEILALINELFFPTPPEVRKLQEMKVEEYIDTFPKAETGKKNVQALWKYENPLVKTAVWEIKYSKNTVIANRVGEILYAEIASQFEDYMLFENTRKILLIPVPSSRLRYKERGYNQTELICEALMGFDNAKLFEYKKNILARTKEVAAQTNTLTRKEREQNPIGSFGIKKPEEVAKRTVVLIDDVLTTGSTLREAMKMLKNAGAKNVFAFTVAH